MADPITSDNANINNRPDREMNVGGPVNENKRDDSSDQNMVSVKALRTFHKEENMQGEMAHPGDEFEVHQHRAAQLRANGLVEYGDDNHDEKFHGKQEADAIKERIKNRDDVSRIPENSRATPLINPAIEMADAPAAPTGKRK